MKRREFITAIGTAAATPFVSSMSAISSTAPAISYSRYMYGLGVFHARTQASIDVSYLARSMSMSLPQATIMMSEMHASGVIT